MRRSGKERALGVSGKLAFRQAYYLVIKEPKGKEGGVPHFQDTETEVQSVCVVFPRHTAIPKRTQSTQLFPVEPCPWVYHKDQMADVFRKIL